MKLIALFLLFFSSVSSSAAGLDFTSLFESVIGGSAQGSSKQLPVPNPYALQPQWWHYFDGDDDLSPRVENTLAQLKKIYDALSPEDQEAAFFLFNRFTTNLKALPHARGEKAGAALPPRAFNKSYTLEQQLQLNHQRRKFLLEIKKDQEEVEELKGRFETGQKSLDTLLATYLGSDAKPTTKRLLAGLEIMAKRAALAITEENIRVLIQEIDKDNQLLALLEKELEFAAKALDGSIYDQEKLTRDMENAKRNFENKQVDHLLADAYAVEVRGTGIKGRSMKNLMSQNSVHSAVEEALAWAQLAFHSLKYNLIMHVNHLFDIQSKEMRAQLREWKEHWHKIHAQHSNWEKLTLNEQERIRKDHGIYAANSNAADLATLNEARRKEIVETLSKLHQLSTELGNVQWLIEQMEYSIRSSSNFMVRWWEDGTDAMVRLWLETKKIFNMSLFKVFEIPISFLTLLRVIFIIFIALATSFALRLGIKRMGHFYFKSQVSFVDHIESLAHYFILIIGAIAVLITIGLDFNHILILLGALTFGIGFGLQSVALNFFCGLKILFERKIKIGDYIELDSGRYGKVTEIHMQNTVIRTSDGIEIVIPNSELLGSPLVNWTMSDDYRRLHIPFSTAYDNDKNLIRTIVSDAAKDVPCTVHNLEYGDPQVWLVKMGENSLDFELVVWVDYKAKSHTDSKEADYLWAIETALRENNIELPQLQHIIHLRHPPSAELAGI